MTRTRKKASFGFGFAAIVVSVVAFMPRADGGGTVKPGLFDAREHDANGLREGGYLQTFFDIGQKLQSALESPVPADEAFRDITLITRDASETSLVLFGAVIRRDGVVALEESRAFQLGGSTSLLSILPKEWKARGYLPGKYYLPDDRFMPGDEFIVGDQLISGDRFPRLGGSASRFLRQAGVESGGRDMFVLFVVPADERLRESARFKPVFIVGENGFGP